MDEFYSRATLEQVHEERKKEKEQRKLEEERKLAGKEGGGGGGGQNDRGRRYGTAEVVSWHPVTAVYNGLFLKSGSGFDGTADSLANVCGSPASSLYLCSVLASVHQTPRMINNTTTYRFVPFTNLLQTTVTPRFFHPQRVLGIWSALWWWWWW